MRQDLLVALRTIAKRPGYAGSVILTLMLGIGASTMMFSLLDAAVLRPLAFRQPDRLVMLWGVAGPDRQVRGGSFPEVLDWRTMNQTLTDVAIYDETSLNMRVGTEALRVDAEMVSASYFNLLGADAALGRTFVPEEDRSPDARPVAVISDKLWRERFGGRADVLDQPVFFNDRRFAIVGVMPERFAGLSFDTDVWVPSMMVSLTSSADTVRRRGVRWLGALGRLKDGVTIAQAQDDLSRVAAVLERNYPDTNRQRGVLVIEVKQSLLGQTGRLVSALFGAVLLFLVIACANVASLQLARTMSRRKELAVRLALGAGRWRVVRSVLAESLVLSAFAGIGGALLAAWGVSAAAALTPAGALPRYVQLSVDPRALVFALLATLASGLLVAILPAFVHSRSGLSDALRSSGRAVAAGLGSIRRPSVQQLIVVGEVAIAMTLLTGAGLLARSLERQLHVRIGFDPDGVTVARLTLPAARYSPPERMAFVERLTAALATMPRVKAAAIGSDLPLTGNASASVLVADSSDQDVRYYGHFVTPDFFRAIGTPLLTGRAFTAQDRAGAPPVAVISEASAHRLFGGAQAAVGRTFRIGDDVPAVEVVGVVATARYRDLTTDIAGHTSEPDVFFPYAQRTDRDLEIAIRTTPGPSLTIAELQQSVSSLDAGIPVYAVSQLTDVVSQQTAAARFASTLLAIFSSGALLLAAVGLYGLVAYVVGLSGREVAIRLALGANPGGVILQILRNAMVLVAAGLAAGALGAIVAGRALETQLFQTRAADPVTFGTVALLLAVVSALAIVIPARAGTRIDTTASLRAE
ncbi:MAG TPA: ABC transporter permease [Vicinamibacterales bacterium]|nr:ABC transporter permease [Vicinamibacterales bacterium]